MRTILLLALVALAPTFASAKEKTAKKKAADEEVVSLPAAQVLEKDDALLGLHVSTGSAFGGNAIFNLQGEWMITPNFGAQLVLSHDTYSTSFGAQTITGTWRYSVWALTALASFHADFLKVPNFDPYITLGLGRSFVSSSWDTNMGTIQPVTSDSGGFFVAAYLHARYFLSSAWAVDAQIGTGYGTFGFGVDYVF
jgi:hypothetical protein